jgi:hypothetical protein
MLDLPGYVAPVTYSPKLTSSFLLVRYLRCAIDLFLQIASLLEYPALIESPLAPQLFPKDALDRARELKDEIGSVGAYTGSKGLDNVRKHVAQWLEG